MDISEEVFIKNILCFDIYLKALILRLVYMTYTCQTSETLHNFFELPITGLHV